MVLGFAFTLTLSLIKTLWDASAADRFLETWRQKEKLLKTSIFSFCHRVFNSIQLLYFHFQRFSILISRCFQSRLLQNWCMWERVNLFPSFNKSVADNFENIEAKISINERTIIEGSWNHCANGIITRNKQFLLFPQWLHKLFAADAPKFVWFKVHKT